MLAKSPPRLCEKGWRASEEVAYAIRWARECIGPDDATIATAMAPAFESIAAARIRRWGRY